MTSDDDDSLNLDAIVEPPSGIGMPLDSCDLSVPLAETIHDPIPPLRVVAARLLKAGEEGIGESGEETGKDSVLLEDPDGHAAQTVLLSTWAYMLALLFDGRCTAIEVADAFYEKYNHAIQPEQVIALQNELENASFLHSTSFLARLKQRADDLLEMPSWSAAHAGSAYPAEPGALISTVAGFFSDPDGPGALAENLGTPADSLRALVVPHIDLRVGGATYAHAYKELLEKSQAELIFILGVAHESTGQQLYSVSQKDFETPLGTVHTERNISRRLHEASRADDMAAEEAHRGEHSIEFQAALIQALLVCRCKRTVEIVPVLCASVDHFLARDEDPFHNEEFLRFSKALRFELDHCGKNWCILCSVDLSHVGPEFGHSSMIDERMLKPIERMDRKMLKLVENLDTEGFFNEIARTQNSRHVDAVLAVLTMLHAGSGLLKSSRLLRYDQMLKAHSHSAVSYAAMAFE